jgi:beta-galactosidase
MTNLNLDMAGGALDVVGLSFYTRAHTGDTFDPLHKAYCLSRYRSISREPSRRMWILETEAGPNVRQITKAQRKLNHWMALAHNVKCFLLWIYRCRYSDNQVGNFNMMAWDGSVTNRARYNGEFSKMLQAHGRLLNNVTVGRTAAIFAPELQSILTLATHGGGLVPNLEGAAKELEVCTRSLKGAYKFLWDRNIPADFISEWNLKDMPKYKLILLPMMENMTPEWAEAIRQYVEHGGTVIAESPFAFKDGDNCLHGRAPIFGLEEVFGAWTNDREGRESAPKMVFDNGGTADVFFYWHEWHLAGAQVLAKYETGTPAIVTNRYGKGLAVMAGTEIFRQYFSEPQEATTALLERLAAEAGAEPTARVLVNGDDSAGGFVEVAKLEGTEGVVYIILNHNEEERLVEVFLKDSDGLKDLVTGEPFDGKAFMLPPLGARALFKENVQK